MEPEPAWIESKDEFIEACKVPEGCECVVEHLSSGYEQLERLTGKRKKKAKFM